MDETTQTPSTRLILNQAIGLLETLEVEERAKVIQMLVLFFDINVPPAAGTGRASSGASAPTRDFTPKFSEDRTLSPKEFLLEKRPQTDVERVACLAYYLTHYRDTPHFKTFDLSKLNVEAAQIKLSNPTVAVDNAYKAGLIVPSQKGNKQLSAAGEMFVQALPDRTAAKEKLSQFRPRRKHRKQQSKTDGAQDE